MDGEIRKPSFLVYYDNEVVVLRLPDEEAGKLFKSLFPYGKEAIKPDFDESPALAMAFDILSMAIDRDNERYVQRCEANRENGRKGGRPKKNRTDKAETEETERLFLKPKKADKDRDMDKDKDKDRDMDKDSIYSSESENPPSEPPLIALPLNDKSFHDVFCEDVDDWKELYPAVDIVQELRKMKGWLNSNPTKRKTRRGINRFINSWLAREQDKMHDVREEFTGGPGTQNTDQFSVDEKSITKSKEELEEEIYTIAHTYISQEAFDRYPDKTHELIRLCCPLEDFTREQVDYMHSDWGIKPQPKIDRFIPPTEETYCFWDARLSD